MRCCHILLLLNRHEAREFLDPVLDEDEVSQFMTQAASSSSCTRSACLSQTGM